MRESEREALDTVHRQEMEQLRAESVYAVLADTPKHLRRALARFTESALRRLPATKPVGVEALSALGHACHLRDIEVDGYHVRIRRLRSEEQPVLASLSGEQLAVERAYETADPEGVLQEFEDARRRTLETLRGVSVAEWSRTGVFAEYGTVTLLRLVEILAEHDAGHLAALAGMPTT